MFDFPFHEASVWTGLYCLLFYLIIVISNYRSGLKFPYQIPISSSKRRWTIFFIGFFIVTHCSNGDFFHLQESVYYYWKVRGNTWNITDEEFYSKLALFVEGNYFLFRIIVWGGAFVAFCWTAKRMEISVYYAAILLIATHSLIFGYARASLAMAVYFLGLSFLSKPSKSKLLSYCIGFFLIFLSLKFHNSAIIMIAMTLMLFVPMRKWNIILVLVLIPLIAVVFKDYFALIAFSDSTDEAIAKKIQNYSERELQHGISGIINMILEYTSFYLPFILTSIALFFKEGYKKCPVEILRFYKVAFGLVFVSIVFAFLGSSYITFVYRILFMSMIPVTLIVTKLYQIQLLSRKHLMWIVISGVAYLVYAYMYAIYCTIVG